MKLIKIMFMFFAVFSLTGCLEELLASLCNRLASNNSIISVLVPLSPIPEGYKAKLVYQNQDADGNPSVTFHECDDAFKFPNGEKKISESGEISFVRVLDSSANTFFLNGDSILNSTDQFNVTIQFFANCDPATPAYATFVSSSATLQWQQSGGDIPPELAAIEECSITGEAAMITIIEQE